MTKGHFAGTRITQIYFCGLFVRSSKLSVQRSMFSLYASLYLSPIMNFQWPTSNFQFPNSISHLEIGYWSLDIGHSASLSSHPFCPQITRITKFFLWSFRSTFEVERSTFEVKSFKFHHSYKDGTPPDVLLPYPWKPVLPSGKFPPRSGSGDGRSSRRGCGSARAHSPGWC